MKRFILIFLILLFVFSGYAKHIDENTAKLVAKAYISSVLDKTDISTFDFTNADKYIDGEEYLKSSSGEIVYFYIFNINKNKGFIIVSGDDNAEPVLGYSEEGDYNKTNISSNFQYWLDGYKSQIKYIIDNKVSAAKKITEKWNNLIKGNYSLEKSMKKGGVEPLIHTHWTQSPYYNDLCPVATPWYIQPQIKCVTGCVATAMSQIIQYWGSPINGKGYHSYTHPSFNTLSFDYDNTTFDYAHMPDSLSENSSPEEVEAVATLMYACGVSVDMDYGMSLSSAWVIYADNPVCAETAFKTYFGYDSKTIQGLKRSDYSDSDWKDLLKNELDNQRPIQYAGWGGGGHTWVCTGYDSNDYFYMDWGSGGADNGYFKLDSLNLTNGNNFNSRQQALIGIQPGLQADKYEINNTQISARTLPLTWINDTAVFKTTGSNIHIADDVDYYKIYLDAGYNYSVSARVHDGKNSGNGNSYSCDVKWSYDKGLGWSITYDDLMPGKISLKGQGTVTFLVVPFSEGLTGTYLLDLSVARVSSVGIQELGMRNQELGIKVYPNPVNQLSVVSYQLSVKSQVRLDIYDIAGRNVKMLVDGVKEKGEYSISFNANNICSGVYFIKLAAGDNIVTKKLIVAN